MLNAGERELRAKVFPEPAELCGVGRLRRGREKLNEGVEGVFVSRFRGGAAYLDLAEYRRPIVRVCKQQINFDASRDTHAFPSACEQELAVEVDEVELLAAFHMPTASKPSLHIRRGPQVTAVVVVERSRGRVERLYALPCGEPLPTAEKHRTKDSRFLDECPRQPQTVESTPRATRRSKRRARCEVLQTSLARRFPPWISTRPPRVGTSRAAALSGTPRSAVLGIKITLRRTSCSAIIEGVEPSRLVAVDGQNNAIVDVPLRLFSDAGLEPQTYSRFFRAGAGPGFFRIKVGAACTRFLGDTAGVGEDPRAWPSELPDAIAATIVHALPHADARIDRLRREGRRVAVAVYSNDVGRVRGIDPLLIRDRYRASAASVTEYEELVRRIKLREETIEQRAESIAELLLTLPIERGAPSASEWTFDRGALDPGEPAVRSEGITVDGYRAGSGFLLELTDAAERFLESSAHLAHLLGEADDIDWSGVVIGYCKAAEVEAVARLIDPLCAQLREEDQVADDLQDRTTSAVARYCRGNPQAPDLGALRFFLAAAATSKRRIRTSRVLQTFVRLAQQWRGREWLLDERGAIAALKELTERYRNRAAHTGQLAFGDYAACRDLVIGEGGLLPRLVDATSVASDCPGRATP